MAALRELELPRSRRRAAVYAVLAALLAVGGLAAVLVGLFGSAESDSAAGLMGAGAVAIVLAVSLFAPRLVRPLASVSGAPLERLRGLTGRLARENTQRKPDRTAVTAAALMIGLALVSFVTVFAEGIKGSIDSAVDRNFQGELVIQNIDGFSPIPPRAAEAARQVPGVQTVSTLRQTQAELSGKSGKPRVSGLDPATAGAVLTLDWEEGSPQSLRELTDRQTILDEGFASSNDLDVGDRVSFVTQAGESPSYEITGTVKDTADLIGAAIVSQRTLARDFDQSEDTFDFVKLAPGVDSDAVQERVSVALERPFPTTEVLNQQELKDRQAQQINQLLGLIYALLSLAVIVSLFGIANTLALSIHERTRELGMLRAIGMSRRQVRTMIRYEAVITALIGAVLGMVLGVIFAALIASPLEEEGFTLSYPVATLILLLVAAAIAGVIAAIGPARRAAPPRRPRGARLRIILVRSAPLRNRLVRRRSRRNVIWVGFAHPQPADREQQGRDCGDAAEHQRVGQREVLEPAAEIDRDRGDRQVADQDRPGEPPQRHPRRPACVGHQAEGEDRHQPDRDQQRRAAALDRCLGPLEALGADEAVQQRPRQPMPDRIGDPAVQQPAGHHQR